MSRVRAAQIRKLLGREDAQAFEGLRDDAFACCNRADGEHILLDGLCADHGDRFSDFPVFPVRIGLAAIVGDVFEVHFGEGAALGCE